MRNHHSIDNLLRTLRASEPFHFIGVAGSGMRPLAEFTAAHDSVVTGSDRSEIPSPSRVTGALEGSSADQKLLRQAKTIVFSSAISEDHPSLVFAKSAGTRTLHRSELLSMFTNAYRTIAVSGTHGKSTTSALIAHVLTKLGFDPSWIIGAPFSDGTPAFQRGQSDVLVIEADESDGSFLRYSPFITVLNNIEPDHMDFYRTVGRLEDAFKNFIGNTSPSGGVVYWGDSPPVVSASKHFPGRSLTFGRGSNNSLRLIRSETVGLSSLSEVDLNGKLFKLELPLPGQHNVLNALASVSVAVMLGVDPGLAFGSFALFPGVQRRLQRYPTTGSGLVFDDYAHNPGKISSCLAGILAAYPQKNILVIFQPHRFSRISSLYEQFLAAFRGPRISVIVLPVYAAGESEIPGFSPETIADGIARTSLVKSFPAQTLKEAADLVKSIINPEKDIVLTIGAGDVWRLAKEIAAKL